MMLLGYLTNQVGDSVPLLDRPFNTMAWYLPPKSAANRSANTSCQQMGPGIYGSFGSDVHGGTAFPRIARHYEAVGGGLADPEAAGDVTLAPGTGCAALDLGADYRLLLDGATGQVLIEHRPSDTRSPIWGGEATLHAQSWFGLDNGTAIAIEAGAAADHPDAVVPTRIDITRDGVTLSLRADDWA